MRCGVVQFPGSNSDHDVYHVLKHVMGLPTRFLWHKDEDLGGSDFIVLPGGFSYGDYLRAGAMAAHSPIMGAVRRHAEAGGPVLGICNGFQILVEAGLLPGAMRRNEGQRFVCRDVHLRVERTDTPFTRRYRPGQVVTMPIAHSEGNYDDTDKHLDALEAAGCVVLRYVAPESAPEGGSGDAAEAPHWNPNGSARAIAGVVNRGRNVLGLMPHPERCAEEVLGGTDGLEMFRGVLESVGESASAAGVSPEAVSAGSGR